MTPQKEPFWLLWTFTNAPVLGILVLCVLTLLIVIVSFQYSLNSELVSIEEKLKYNPPQGNGLHGNGEEFSGKETHWVYVPAYSHIYHAEGTPILLAVTLSIRNIDPHSSLRVRSVRYYDTQGKFIKEYVAAPVLLPGLSTVEYLVEQKNIEGGSGANFIVEWSAPAEINPPILETVMIGSQGISFVCSGREIRNAT